VKVAPVTVLTVTIPGRETAMLGENIASVYAQTLPVTRQLICAHLCTDGPAMVQYVQAKNLLLRAVQTEWVAVLNDDDYWLPQHVELLMGEARAADVIYSWETGRTRPRIDANVNDWPRERLTRQLEEANLIDGNAMIRTRMLRRVGGFPADWVGDTPHNGGHYQDSPARFEDHELWRRIHAAGGQFRCVPVETWHYRTGHPDRIS
jgi:hypothetical protein